MAKLVPLDREWVLLENRGYVIIPVPEGWKFDFCEKYKKDVQIHLKKVL